MTLTLFESLKWSIVMSLFCQLRRDELASCLVTVSNHLSQMNARPEAVVKETIEAAPLATSLVTWGTEVYTYLFGQLPRT